MIKRLIRLTVIAICFVLGVQLVGCNPTVVPSAGYSEQPSGTDGASQSANPTSAVSPTPSPDPIQPVGEFVQQPAVRDYSYLWWKNGFLDTNGAQLNIQTGYYALAIKPRLGLISCIGALEQEIPQAQAGSADIEDLIDSMSAINRMDYGITADGSNKKLKNITAIDLNSGSQRAAAGDDIAVSRIIESGRYMQCIDIMNLNFAGESDITGRVEIAAMPKYFSVDFSLWSKTGREDIGLSYGFTLNNTFTSVQQNGNTVTARRDNGSGITFLLPDGQNAGIQYDNNTHIVTVSANGLKIKKRTFTGINIIVIPSLNATAADADEFYKNSSAEGSAVQIYPREGREQKVTFDTKGYLSFSLNNMLSYMGPDFNVEERLDMLDRLSFTIKNTSDTPVKVPVQFTKNGNFGVLGCSPFLRDIETGEPIGVQVQLSKNWHEPVNYSPDDPASYLAGTWFHGYSYIEVPANSSVNYEFTMSYAKWGGAFAVSHSQLCLAGWGGNYQQWESSSIGSFGESFCYDAEMVHGRGYITDIRPLLVNSIYGGKYYWTENVGGGNFLTYTASPWTKIQNNKQLHTQFRKQGPNLTEVIYRGLSSDGKIQFEYIANLPRTNDVSRAYHSFSYTFLEDVTFDRLAFYQFGSDNYNDNGYGKMAVGNNSGTVDIKLGDTVYSGDFDLPVLDSARYIGADGMQRVEIPGDGIWVAFMDYYPVSYKATPGGNRMFRVDSYSASINGKTYSKPSLSFYHTTNGGIPCVAVELTPPAEAGDTIKKGSTVTGTVEFLVMPVAKSDYYGPSSVINAMSASDFNTSKPAFAYAVGAGYTVKAAVGTVIKNTPVYVACADSRKVGEAAAEITVKGGMGYVPLTFTNVAHYSGYSLEVLSGSTWKKVDQSVIGNDYWQAWYDADTRTYELTYNVEHFGDPNAEYTYRLVRLK